MYVQQYNSAAMYVTGTSLDSFSMILLGWKLCSDQQLLNVGYSSNTFHHVLDTSTISFIEYPVAAAMIHSTYLQ